LIVALREEHSRRGGSVRFWDPGTRAARSRPTNPFLAFLPFLPFLPFLAFLAFLAFLPFPYFPAAMRSRIAVIVAA
jgi:hypothetical protein